ncbi:MAG: plasmid stabilization protein [Nitrospirae bacterium GWA2_42_11]|nr:MAG: plasmid stabilization protein [Nitrospirae bacterium GWA2_42_11]OGW63893.1 MAG: plasmid stabilization protein [Nitrospirae bacterium RIFCSPHIGHO2_02_FULL_40_19]
MKINFLKPAQSEIDDAFAWYEAQSHGLGTKFLDDFDRAVRRIVAFPFASAEIEDGLRRCLLSRFPYGIIYGIDSETIIVVAVAHLHREPRYWVDRLLKQGTNQP